MGQPVFKIEGIGALLLAVALCLDLAINMFKAIAWFAHRM